MAKVKYYYYTIKSGTDNVIATLLSSNKAINKTAYHQITKDEYDNYKNIIASVPNRDGYIKKVTLYVDGTYDVEYTEIVEEETEE